MRRLLLSGMAIILLAQPCRAQPADATALAARIDELLDARWREEGVERAPAADDAEFLRRAYLDITGRIPRSADVYAFLADKSPDKRTRLIDRLLEEPRFAVHFSRAWRAELIPETASNRQAALLERGFENWLIEQIRSGVGYDRWVRELLTAPIAATGQAAEPVLRDPERPNPLAFFAAKDAKPENLAAAVTRTFLGLRLECAECHDHPFADWKQEQFWQQAAFFAGIKKQGGGLLAPLNEDVTLREITPSNNKPTCQAVFLDGTTPAWSGDKSPRVRLVDWITSPDNPYFARAAANRVWAQFFGRGLVDPVDDFHDNNPPSHPELLDELTRAFVASNFDMHFLVQAICRSKAYGRSSAREHFSPGETGVPASAIVKSLSGEQLFDSLAVATGYRDDQDRQAARRQFLTRFALTGVISEPETSVQQALTLLNGRFTSWASDSEKCPTLIAVAEMPGMSADERIEALYVATLSRLPTSEELSRLREYVSGREERVPARQADLFWALLNTAEFRLNH